MRGVSSRRAPGALPFRWLEVPIGHGSTPRPRAVERQRSLRRVWRVACFWLVDTNAGNLDYQSLLYIFCTDIRTGVVQAALRAAVGPKRSMALLVVLLSRNPHFESRVWRDAPRLHHQNRGPPPATSAWARSNPARCARDTAQKHCTKSNDSYRSRLEACFPLGQGREAGRSRKVELLLYQAIKQGFPKSQTHPHSLYLNSQGPVWR